MTFRGFAYRLAYIVLFTWIVGSITGAPGWALYLAFLPITFHELFRFRRTWHQDEQELDQDL